jgi:hypothetical protein
MVMGMGKQEVRLMLWTILVVVVIVVLFLAILRRR